ncbi:PUA-like domain-containing protein, partial [Catenaria anguillulae PL171]
DFEDLLECQLCYQLLHDPVTLYPCGHTACRACILRTLDHAPRCFLCRTPLESSSYLTYHAHAPNRTLQKFVWHNFPRESWVRAQVLALEARDLLSQVPIFICSLTLPGAPVHLHVFEPRYRLMMRRVTAPGAPRLFGMCMPDPRGLPGPAQYGSMLKVDSLQWLPDGRCLVQAQAVYAIKVTETGCTDGYCTARVEGIPRACPAGGEGNVKVRDLVCHASRKLGVFLERLPSVQARHQFLSQFGCMPCDPALFAYWLAGVLPVPVQEKYKLLGMTSARDRLITVMRWFKCVR